MKLAVVIVNYNVKHFLEQCLKSVREASNGLQVETWVVDNNSVDGSVEMVRDIFPDVKLIANTYNYGFSKANNQAIEQSDAEYVLLLNPDTVVPADCFDKLIAFMEQHPDAGACGVRMVDGQGKFLPESKRGLPTPEVALYKMAGLNRLFPKSKKFGKYHLGYLPEFEVNKVEVLAGAFMFIRKKVLDEIGLLDERFFMYGEDIDLSYRITKAGYQNYYVPLTSIIHYKGESTKKQSVNYVRVFYKAMILFAEKHYSGRFKNWFTALINIAIYLRAGLSLFLNFFQKHGLKLAELILVFGSLYALVDYWEEHIKYIKAYPREMLSIHLPYYSFTWISALIISGSYKEKFNFSKLIRGTLLGTGLILIIYGLLPDNLHFSRGIILFGFLLVTAVLVVFRSLIHWVKYRSLDLNKSGSIQSLVVGNASTYRHIQNILDLSSRNYQQIGYVALHENEGENCLGTLEQLQEIVQVFGVNEIIFSAEHLSTSETMKWMKEIGPSVNYFIVPKDSDFAIGSHSKNSTGLYFGQQIALRLSKSDVKSQKRIFDFISGLLLFLLLPLTAILFNRKGFYKDLSDVIRGSKTWVSYSTDSVELPTLKEGVYTTNIGLTTNNEQQDLQLDRMYARNYSLGLDLNLLWKGLRQKGSHNS